MQTWDSAIRISWNIKGSFVAYRKKDTVKRRLQLEGVAVCSYLVWHQNSVPQGTKKRATLIFRDPGRNKSRLIKPMQNSGLQLCDREMSFSALALHNLWLTVHKTTCLQPITLRAKTQRSNVTVITHHCWVFCVFWQSIGSFRRIHLIYTPGNPSHRCYPLMFFPFLTTP